MSQASDTMRREWKINDAKRDAGLTTPEDICRYDDLVYGPDPVWNKLDVYRPKNLEGKLPVIVNVHGGGWIYGDKNKRITKYASFCGAGLGDEEVEQAIAAGAELVVSADIPHHVLLNAIQKGLCVLSCTHYGTENYGMKKFSEKCAAEIKNLKIYFFEDERFI